MESGQRRLAKRMRWAGRVIALVIVLFGAFMFIGEAVSEVLREGWTALFSPVEVVVIALVLIGVVALAGCVLSWRRDGLAGILLVVTAAALGAHIGVYAGRNHLLAWAMLGLPFLTAGALLISSWRLSRKLP